MNLARAIIPFDARNGSRNRTHRDLGAQLDGYALRILGKPDVHSTFA